MLSGFLLLLLFCVCVKYPVISSGLGTEEQNKLKLEFFALLSQLVVNCLLRLLISPHGHPPILLSCYFSFFLATLPFQFVMTKFVIPYLSCNP